MTPDITLLIGKSDPSDEMGFSQDVAVSTLLYGCIT